MQESVMLTNFSRLRDVMKSEKLDAIVGTCAENVTYLSGFWAMSQWVRRGPQAYVLHTADAQPGAVIAHSGGVDLIADQEVWVEDIRRYGFFQIDVDKSAGLSKEDQRQARLLQTPAYQGPVEALCAALKDRGIGKARIGVDEQGITPQCWDQLSEMLPGATLVRAFALMEKVRAIKMPEEIARLREAARISCLSIEAALAAARPGITEREMLRIFQRTTVEHDANPVTNCIGFGDRSAMSNVQPSDRALRRGDTIRFDVGCRYRHYRSDVSRTGFFGEPPAKLLTYYRALEKGVLRAYEIIKPGRKVTDLFDRVVDTVRREGIPHYQRSHVGHGIGVDGYDPPNLGPGGDTALEENMVICVETPYYELGFAGLQVEDMVRVTRDGVESLMPLGTELRLIGWGAQGP
jgi:Xaa-Pro dipeptidase